MAASGNDRVGGVASGRMLYELTQRQGVNMARNMQVLLASRPTGWVEEANFKIVETDVPKPGPGEVLVKNLWLSLDPYMRGRMNAVKLYAISNGEALAVVDPNLVPLTAYLGVCGMPGGTAWIGLLEHCAPKVGET